MWYNKAGCPRSSPFPLRGIFFSFPLRGKFFSLPRSGELGNALRVFVVGCVCFLLDCLCGILLYDIDLRVLSVAIPSALRGKS
ncbi:MAG: hypothetical protein LBQ66_00035 [Planctomycetaceae bacterium]|nr:hypothetical protein [Planctomycetaceae bacterium]